MGLDRPLHVGEVPGVIWARPGRKNGIKMNMYIFPGPEPDLAPREAEVMEGSQKLST